jgi:hypothetical protein
MKKVSEFLKRYWIAVLSGVVILLSVVATLLWPIPGMFGKLQSEMDQRPGTFGQINTLLSAQRTLPRLDPAQTEPGPLTVFPTESVIERGEQAVQRLRAEADATLNAAVQLNRRTPLVQGALPADNRLARQAFLDQYKKLFVFENTGQLHPILVNQLGAGTAPTQAEVQIVAERRAGQIQARLVPGVGGQPGNQAQIERELAEMRASVGAEIRGARAERIRIYVSPTAIVPHPIIQEQLPPALVPTFNAQLMLWLQEIVIDAIASVNREAGSTNVLDAPIKHLVSLEVPVDYAVAVEGQASVEGGDTADASVATPAFQADQVLARDFQTNVLGVKPNSLFEPFGVTLKIRVDADRLPQVLSTLSRGRLLLITNVNVQAVGSAQSLQEGFVYGQAPVVEAVIEAQVLILRPWLADYMPPAVKQFFQMTANPPAAG